MKEYKNIPIPITKEPYVNTFLYPAGFEKDTGLERYWISSCNINIGSTGILVNENGEEKRFVFQRANSSPMAKSLYSACYAGNDIMWLAGDLSQVIRLDLSTGGITEFKTGAPSGLVFTGMVYDEATKKLFFSAFVSPREISVSFDTVKGETVRIYDDTITATCSNGNIPNGDGTYTVTYIDQNSGNWHYAIWDPCGETLEEAVVTKYEIPNMPLMKDGKAYISCGNKRFWYDPSDRSFSKENICDRSAVFFGSNGDIAYGADQAGDEAQILAWDMKGSEHKVLCSVPESGGKLMRLTRDEKIVVFTLYGDFYKFDSDGNQLMFKELDSRAYGNVDCIVLTNDGILVGTPFITQRFWVHDLNTGIGYDAGRAADGGGEVLQVRELNGKVYMASYTKGRLTEYDPKKPANFPDNPRIVTAPKNSMRPVCKADDGVNFYYSSNHPYGRAGCEFTKYNTLTGETLFNDSPVDGLAFRSMQYNKKYNVLVAGSTVATDCGIAKETADICCLAVFSADTLKPVSIFNCEKGVRIVTVAGAINEDEYLVLMNGSFKDAYVMNISKAVSEGIVTCTSPKFPILDGWYIYAERDGYFIHGADGAIDLVRIENNKCEIVKGLVEKDTYKNIYSRVFYSNSCILVLTRTTIDIYKVFD
ncbi:MAG: hypothetical protein E7665_09470 [Ruminococcaceae bacterium]|nr:hypothetical protein [Oscillospiraceae bacterium]